MEIDPISENNLDILRGICLDPSVDKKTKIFMENSMEERITWVKEIMSKGLEILVAHEKPRNEIIHYKWAGKMLHSDLAIQGRVYMGLLEYIPIEHALEAISGENSLFINCMWILPPFWQTGTGKALLESFVDKAREFGGASVIAYENEKWFGTSINYMPASFFKKFGFQEIERDGTRVLLYLDLGLSSPPKFIPFRSQDFDDISGPCLDIFFNSQCPWARFMINTFKQGLEKYPQVKIQCISTDKAEISRSIGISRGICFNGKPIIKRMASWEELKSKIGEKMNPN
jgi:GNAT superfamily N-acetyltransferase